MSFLEKSAWLMATILVVLSGCYFGLVLNVTMESGEFAAPSISLFIGWTVVLIILSVVGHLFIAIVNPKNTSDNPDEREILINHKAGHISSSVLGAGVVLSLLIHLLIMDGNLLFYCVFASLLLSELANYILRIYFYRASF